MRLLLALALALAPAAAPNPGGPYGQGFQAGRTVGVQLENSTIVITGTGLGAKPDGYRIKRPCWYEPGRSAEDMLKTQEDLRAFWFHTNPNSTEEEFQEFLKQFKDKIGQPGRWWAPAYNAADPGGMSCWSALEGAIWVDQGNTPPAGITMTELLDIARAALTVPEPQIQLNPDAKSYVNLPTFVWLNGQGQTTRSVTATLPGLLSATVTATLDDIKIDAGTTSDRAEVKENCGPAGRPYAKGAAFTCGVRYLRASADQPRKVYTLTVTTVWPVTSNADQSVVPFVFDPVEGTVTRDVQVGEVQSTVKG
ncbi:hypothetical protein Aph01nite_02890 [Acrocarpospora phusangensis]|uniref:Enoyl reductase n=1 Tax=Acrocarpospora phusangensis TaxID=1070424 RepID=A0A919UHE9_9ACTN|nr:hypothetical protein [Acrocarpospora phusangensis]GIH21979.1 hypothetical protein Aph01nite_02890 [Acrocarpospora phusangensis]